MAKRARGKEKAAEPDSLRELAYRHLQSKLALGELPAGEPLSELAFASELAISRTPVREALNLLVAEGFLEHFPNRGVYVRQLARQDIVELYELREALEVHAVGKLSQQGLSGMDQQDLARQVDAVARLREELESSGGKRLNRAQIGRFNAADLAFHNRLLQAAGNSRFLKVVSDTRLLIRIFALPHEGHDAAQLNDIHRYHAGVLSAVSAGQVAMAQQTLADHIRTSLRERLEAHDVWERQHSMARALSGMAG